ncbi:reverse transcriptase domain-containing protein [Tanacetum coccineum]|uniref:Reverse transcriptase domain-containing protein n=1 Tax=Tanacetum coccineum TaxID=301880 RepID=A0ABQ5DE82_9ASTR
MNSTKELSKRGMNFKPLSLADSFPQLFLIDSSGEIRAFSQHENETLTEAWLRMKEMLRNCHGHNLSKGNIIKIIYHGLNEITQEALNAAAGGIFLYKIPNQAYQLLEDKVLLKLDWTKNQKTKTSLKKTIAFTDEGISNSNTDKIMARMDAMTMKMDAQYKEFQPRSKQPNPDHNDDDIPMSRKEEAKFMKTFHHTRFYHDYRSRMPNYGKFLKELFHQNLESPEVFSPCNFNKAFSCDALADLGASINLMAYSLYAKLSLETLKPTKMSVRLADRSFQYPIGIAENMLVEVGKFTFPVDFVILEMEEDSKVPLILGRPFLYTADAVIRVKQKQLNLRVGTKCMTFHMDSTMKHSYSNDDTCFSIDVIDEILEEDFAALLDKGSKILYSIKGTPLEDKLFSEFDEFITVTAKENSESESDTKEPPFKKITFNTSYKIKTSLEEPPTDLELKPIPDNLECVFLEEPSFLPVIISSQLSKEKKNKLVFVLKTTSKPLLGKQQTILMKGIKHCKRWYWCDPELEIKWYRTQLYEMHLLLNPSQREELENELTSREELAVLQVEFADMEGQMQQVMEELKKSQMNACFWKSTAIVFGIVASFMFVMN